MIVTMHQPEHLPWLGFFHKMALADLYVVMDAFQYRHQYFQNRNRIQGVQGALWITVPVLKRQHRYGPIAKVAIDQSRDWRKPYWGSIAYNYRKHPYFETYAPALKAIIDAPHALLCDFNLALIEFFREALGIATPMIHMSSLAVDGQRGDAILEIARQTQATVYLSGPSGKDYLDETPFRDAGIAVRYDAFEHPIYDQKGKTRFTPNLSTLDLLMNFGPASAALFLPGRRPAQAPTPAIR